MWYFVPSDITLRIVFLILLILLSAFFSSAETALTTVNKIRIRTLADDGDRRAATVLRVLSRSDKMLSCILIGNNVVNISASSLATTLAIRLYGNNSVGYITGVLTMVILIFGEITPKNAANVSSEKLSLRYARIVSILMTLMTPLIFLVGVLASAVMALLHISKDGGDSTITEDEIRTMVDVSHEEGETSGAERELINNVFDFGGLTAKDICVPRADMVSVSADESYENVARIYRTERYTRLPVYEKDRDHIVGILNIKDFCFVTDRTSFRPRRLMYAPYFTYESKPVGDLMVEMREHLAALTIVLDEYGAAAGMLTLEDLIEELVGEIRDEYDEDEKNWVVKVKDGEYLIEGSVKLDDVNDRIGTSFSSDEYDSIGGYVIEKLGRLPHAGETVEASDGIRIVVESMKRNRISKVHVFLPDPEESGKKTDPESASGM